MSDFYIKLPSNGSNQEYPKSKSNSFTIRLPEPIRLGPDWKVGLTSISLPDTNGVLSKFTLNDEPLFTMRWFSTRISTIPTNSVYVKSREENFRTENLSVNFGGLDGVGFMKTVVNFFETQRLIQGNTNTDVLKGWYLLSNPFDLKAKKNLSYMNFVWQGDELLMDNSETFNQFDEHAKKKIAFGINKHLCHQMKWILQNDDDETYQLGPNLKMEIHGAEIPNPDKPGTYEDLQTSDGEAAFFLAKDEYYFFSIHINWRFLNLNAAYSNMIASPSRTLLVYSDVSRSSVLGDQKVDILREVQYEQSGRGVFYFEPKLPQYIPVRKDFVDIVEVQVGEITGELTEFSEGETILTLHFKQE